MTRSCRHLLGAFATPAMFALGAAHDFDNPLPARQRDEANREARADSMRRAEAAFARFMKP